MQSRTGYREAAARLLAGFRRELHQCLGRRRDALFELADAVLCKQDRVHVLAERADCAATG